MKRYRGSRIKIDWRDDELMSLVEKKSDEVTKIGAEIVVESARRNLERQGAVDTGDLVDQIEIRSSKFKNGGYIIEAQGRGNYSRFYATFIELGGHYSLWGKYSVKKGNNKEGPYFEPRPYLRPAIKQVRRVFRKLMVEALAGSKTIA